MIPRTPVIPLVLALVLLPAGASAGDYRHVTVAGDNLWNLSDRLLRHPSDWPLLQKLNGIDDPLHLPVGKILSVPLHLLRRETVAATAGSVRGSARLDGAALVQGSPVRSGQVVETGTNGYVALDMADGSRLVLQPESRLKVGEMQRSTGPGIYRTRLELLSGRVENQVAKQLDQTNGYRLHTPAAVIAVRGTGFRVTAEAGRSRAEVTEGTVRVRGRKGGNLAVGEGEGVQVADGKPLQAKEALLPAADVSAVPDRIERVAMRLYFKEVPGTARYRVQIAADPGFAAVLADKLVDAPPAKFSDIPDGQLWLRVRGIAPDGMEGRDAVRAFALKARPEPPFGSSPLGGVSRGKGVDFAWSQAEEAASYRIQVAPCGDFAQVVGQASNLKETAWHLDLPPGRYAWRLASVRADGDAGPWGDAIPFELRPLPPNPEPPKVAGDQLEFAWAGEAGQRYQFQMASDKAFTQNLMERSLSEPRVSLPRPSAGTWHMRVKATDPDGFVGPWTATQSFVVPQRPWWLLLGLLPLVF